LNAVAGYVVVFFVEAGLLVVSLVLLRRIDATAFAKHEREYSTAARAALLNDAA